MRPLVGNWGFKFLGLMNQGLCLVRILHLSLPYQPLARSQPGSTVGKKGLERIVFGWFSPVLELYQLSLGTDNVPTWGHSPGNRVLRLEDLNVWV